MQFRRVTHITRPKGKKGRERALALHERSLYGGSVPPPQPCTCRGRSTMSSPSAPSPSRPRSGFATRAAQRCSVVAQLRQPRPRRESPCTGSRQPSYTEDAGQQGTSIAPHLMLGRGPAPKTATATQAAKRPRGALVSSTARPRGHPTAPPCPASAALSSKRCKLVPSPCHGGPGSAPAITHTSQRGCGLLRDTGPQPRFPH